MTAKMGYHNILVAADFSSGSQAALNQAISIAKDSGAKVTVVHVLPELRKTMHSATIDAKLDLLYGEGSRFYEEVLGSAQKQLQEMIARSAGQGLQIRVKFLLGEPAVEICRAVHQGQHDLVVAGTRNLASWKAFFLGTTASRLIRKCPAPVWVVKPSHAGKPRSVLAPTDFSDVSRQAVLAALQVAADAQASCHLLHVIDSGDVPENAVAVIPEGGSLRQEINEAAKHRLKQFVESLDFAGTLQPHLTWGTPWQEIQRLASELNVDLIAMGTVGHSGVPGLLLGSTAEKVLRSCDCSLLTVKPESFKSPIPLA